MGISKAMPMKKKKKKAMPMELLQDTLAPGVHEAFKPW